MSKERGRFKNAWEEIHLQRVKVGVFIYRHVLLVYFKYTTKRCSKNYVTDYLNSSKLVICYNKTWIISTSDLPGSQTGKSLDQKPPLWQVMRSTPVRRKPSSQVNVMTVPTDRSVVLTSRACPTTGGQWVAAGTSDHFRHQQSEGFQSLTN